MFLQSPNPNETPTSSMMFSLLTSAYGALFLLVLDPSSIIQQASQVAQWSRICLPMQETQETWVWSLGWADPLGNPLQYSCLEYSMDREAWWATAHKVTKSQTRLSSHEYSIIQHCHIFASHLVSCTTSPGPHCISWGRATLGPVATDIC